MILIKDLDSCTLNVGVLWRKKLRSTVVDRRFPRLDDFLRKQWVFFASSFPHVLETRFKHSSWSIALCTCSAVISPRNAYTTPPQAPVRHENVSRKRATCPLCPVLNFNLLRLTVPRIRSQDQNPTCNRYRSSSPITTVVRPAFSSRKQFCTAIVLRVITVLLRWPWKKLKNPLRLART